MTALISATSIYDQLNNSFSTNNLLQTAKINLEQAENRYAENRYIVGLDEVGRGCLAGPVVAAAVILPKSYNLPNLGDSKDLDSATRTNLAKLIKNCAINWSLGVVMAPEIDRINILQASLLAMAKALKNLKVMPVLAIIDGNKLIPENFLDLKFLNNKEFKQTCIVKADSKIDAVAAASILAKVWRDNLMLHLDQRWQGYNFAQHKGYATKEHYDALRKLGPCPIHRKSFKGVLPENPCQKEQKSKIQNNLLDL